MSDTLSFYKKFPELFSSYFIETDFEQNIDLFCQAGYAYSQSVLILDSIIDDEDTALVTQMIEYQEDSIKKLSSIYGLNSPFWDYWNIRRKEYYEAIKIEEELRKKDTIKLSVYEDLANKKASFEKVAIDGLFVLSKTKDQKNYDLLLQSHRLFSIGFQLYDDLKDFKEDIQKEQFNWVVMEAKKQIDFAAYDYNIDTIKKLVYINGIGQSILTKIINYFERSINMLIANGNIQSKWMDLLNCMVQTVQHYLNETIEYVNTIENKLKAAS